MPPFSPVAKGFLPNSMKLFWPMKPCQPSLATQGGSMRPVECLVVELGTGPVAIEEPVQSALEQYTAPGTDKLLGRGVNSYVFARLAPMVELPHSGTPGWPQVGEPSAGPP